MAEGFCLKIDRRSASERIPPLTTNNDIVHSGHVKTTTRLRLCVALTKELNERLGRAYIFAHLDEPGRVLFQKAEQALLQAQDAFQVLSEYEEERS